MSTREIKADTVRPRTRCTSDVVSWRNGLIAATAIAFGGSMAGPAAAQSDPPGPSASDSHSVASTAQEAEKRVQAQWRESIIKKETPSTGCFQATFPSTEWESAPCREAPRHAHPIPRRRRPGDPETAGNTYDYVLSVNGLISQTVGSFPAVSGLASESSVGGVPGESILGANEYSLQLNTNSYSTTAACSGSGSSDCYVWQQFVYTTNAGSAAVYMQYWLLNYGARGASCPSGYWTSGLDCYTNSSAVAAPDVPLTSLENLKLTGNVVQGGNDTITFANGTTAYSVSAPDSVLDIATVWDQAEFNVFGDGGGSEAVFNPGTEIIVNVAAEYGSNAAPTCLPDAGTTAETNNLNLGPCVTAGGTTPSIQFAESLIWGLSSEFDPSDMKVFYLDNYSNLNELSWNGGWTWLQATGTNSRPSVVPGTQYVSYFNTIYNGDEVFYVANSTGNSHIEQLWGSSLSPTDLTSLAGGVPLAPGTSPAGYIDPVASTDNVFYVGTDQAVHALAWSPAPGWKENALLDATTRPAAAVGSPLAGHTKTCSNGQVCSDEIFYVGANQHVYELWSWSQNPGWQWNDLTSASQDFFVTAPPVAEGSPLVSFNDTVAGIDAVFYLGTNQHVYELLFNSSGHWNWFDITQQLQTNYSWVPLVGVGSSLAAHVNPMNQTEEVFFLDSNGNVYEAWASSSSPSTWYAAGSGPINGGNPAASGSPLKGGISFNNQDHLWYIGTDNNVHELYWYTGANYIWFPVTDNQKTSPVAPPAAD